MLVFAVWCSFGLGGAFDLPFSQDVAWKAPGLIPKGPIVNPRKLEHRFRMIHAGIPYTLL